MNRFGRGENIKGDIRVTYQEHGYRIPLLTQAYLHYWDKGLSVPADLAARL